MGIASAAPTAASMMNATGVARTNASTMSGAVAQAHMDRSSRATLGAILTS
jgi:hypothetical protein